MEEDCKGFRGLEFAKKLNFTEAHYEEACKMITSPDNTNQLLVALIDVGRRNDTCCATQTSNGNPSINHHHHHQQQQQQQHLAVGGSQYVNPTLPTNSVLESSSSSCYSSITSLPSSSDQSLDILQQQNKPVALKKIYIDGPNIARTHGKDASFSWRGIEIAVDWFLSRHHRVKVFVPEDRCQQPEDARVMDYLQNLDVLVKTPSGCNDDLFVIEAARHNNGIIVSNDLFRDERRLNEVQRFIHLNRLPYVFVDDLFLPASDPRGRAGPMLDDFLRETTDATNVHGKLHRARSYQRYQRNNGSIKLGHNLSAFHHRSSLQSTRSLPMDQNCGSIHDSGNQLVVGFNHCQRQHNQYDYSNHHSHNQQHQRQQLRRSISIAQTAPNLTKDTGNSQARAGRKKALCCSKSHDV